MFHAIQEKDRNQYKLYVDHTEFMKCICHFLFHHAFFIGKFLSLLDLFLGLDDGCVPQKNLQILKRTERILIQKLEFNMQKFKPDLQFYSSIQEGGVVSITAVL